MILGVPKEIKDNEYRVSMVPAGVKSLADAGHTVLVQTGAGLGSGITDGEYLSAGATIAADAEEVFTRAEMVVKVKEPQPAEIARLRRGQIVFTFLHLAPDPAQTLGLLKAGVAGLAYETIEERDGCRCWSAPSTSRGRTVGSGCCWAGCRGCSPPTS
jgi:alanine dehydrogenase